MLCLERESQCKPELPLATGACDLVIPAQCPDRSISIPCRVGYRRTRVVELRGIRYAESLRSELQIELFSQLESSKHAAVQIENAWTSYDIPTGSPEPHLSYWSKCIGIEVRLARPVT